MPAISFRRLGSKARNASSSPNGARGGAQSSAGVLRLSSTQLSPLGRTSARSSLGRTSLRSRVAMLSSNPHPRLPLCRKEGGPRTTTYVALRHWPKGWRQKDSRTALERFVDGQKDVDAATCPRYRACP